MVATTNAEINKAMEELEVAQNRLDFAEPAFVESAIYQYSSALSRLNALIKLAKMQVH